MPGFVAAIRYAPIVADGRPHPEKKYFSPFLCVDHGQRRLPSAACVNCGSLIGLIRGPSENTGSDLIKKE